MASLRRALFSSTRQSLSPLKAICFQHYFKCPSSISWKESISTSSHALKVLSQSTILVQDGISITELPVLIQRADRGSFPFTSHSYTGENIREINQFETSFKEELQNCATVSDVFKLLEVPPDKVEGYSAAFALQRLHILMHLNMEWLQIHSFIRTAVMRELYETVQRDIQLISNSTLISLVDCYQAAQGFSPSCLEAINDEISFRLVAGVFNSDELVGLIQSLTNSSSRSIENIFPSLRDHPSLSEVLFENASKFLSSGRENESGEPFDKFIAKANPAMKERVDQKCSEMLRNAWVHLASRYQELTETSLPLTMQLLPLEQKNFVHLLEKPLSQIWYHLSPEGTSICLDNLLRLRVPSSSMIRHLGQWAYVNIHLITPSLLLSILNVCIRFTFIDKNIIRVIERCLQKSGPDAPTDLLALCVEYLRSSNHISPVLMDLAANHFIKHWESYTPLEIFAVLRAFGYLGYLPTQCQGFLKEAENCLHKRFDLLEEAHLLEVLASFTFVNVLPKNFYRRVSSNYFFKKVGNLNKVPKLQALIWLRAMQHAVVLASSTKKDFNRKWVLSQKNKLSIYSFLEPERMAIETLRSGLDELFGPLFYHHIPFYSCFGMYVNDKGIPLEIETDEKGFPTPVGHVSKRLALVLRTASHFSSNTNQLLGAQAQKIAHLEHLGFMPLELHVPELHCVQPTKVLQSSLSNHVDFSAPEVQQLIEKRSKQQEEENLSWSFQFELDEADVMFDCEEATDVTPAGSDSYGGNNWEYSPSASDNLFNTEIKDHDSDGDQ